MYFSAADEAEFGQQAEHATVVEVGVYPEAACAALPGQCHGAAHEFGRYALSFDLLCYVKCQITALTACSFISLTRGRRNVILNVVL